MRAPAQDELLYTFRDAATPAQISTDLRELRGALPAGAIITYTSWLNTENFWQAAGGSIAPLLMAYAIIALVLAMLIAGIVAAAAVVASYRRIGVLKSIGFTPAQIAATYLAQLGIPALAGAVAGTVVGWHPPRGPGGSRPCRRSRRRRLPAPAEGTRRTGWPAGSGCRAPCHSAWLRRYLALAAPRRRSRS
jgi:hypothetical protein